MWDDLFTWQFILFIGHSFLDYLNFFFKRGFVQHFVSMLKVIVYLLFTSCCKNVLYSINSSSSCLFLSCFYPVELLELSRSQSLCWHWTFHFTSVQNIMIQWALTFQQEMPHHEYNYLKDVQQHLIFLLFVWTLQSTPFFINASCVGMALSYLWLRQCAL